MHHLFLKLISVLIEIVLILHFNQGITESFYFKGYTPLTKQWLCCLCCRCICAAYFIRNSLYHLRRHSYKASLTPLVNQ